ncbi:hypothetical protein V8C35DRAFT_287759 [Trichoderma chlorosporum]
MMLSKADSSPDVGSTPAKYASKDSVTAQPERIVVTTREPKAAPATAIIGGLIKETFVDLDVPTVSDNRSTTIVTSTTRVTRTVTIVPPGVVTVTAFPSTLAKESNFKAVIPFFDATASADPPRTTLSEDRVRPFNLSSTSVDAERTRPIITPVGFNASMSFHRVSLSATASGFRTLRRAA